MFTDRMEFLVGTDSDAGAESMGLGVGTGAPGCICHILNDYKIRLDHMSQ
jgi:hypothetical protein